MFKTVCCPHWRNKILYYTLKQKINIYIKRVLNFKLYQFVSKRLNQSATVGTSISLNNNKWQTMKKAIKRGTYTHNSHQKKPQPKCPGPKPHWYTMQGHIDPLLQTRLIVVMIIQLYNAVPRAIDSEPHAPKVSNAMGQCLAVNTFLITSLFIRFRWFTNLCLLCFRSSRRDDL